MFNAIHVTTTYFLTVPYAGIANDSISGARRAALGADPDSLEFVMRVVGSKLQLLSWVSYASALWSLKGALLVFFVNRLSVSFSLWLGWRLLEATGMKGTLRADRSLCVAVCLVGSSGPARPDSVRHDAHSRDVAHACARHSFEVSLV